MMERFKALDISHFRFTLQQETTFVVWVGAMLGRMAEHPPLPIFPQITRGGQMNRMTLVPWIVLVGILEVGIVVGQAAQATHRLGPTPRTVTWGYFDARTPAVLKVRSGDTVEVESLIAVTVEALETAGLQRSQLQPALLEIDREVKERGEIPHILTGPIWVE